MAAVLPEGELDQMVQNDQDDHHFGQMTLFQKSREGGVREGGVAQTVRQIYAKLLVFRFVRHMKGAQNCCEFVENLKCKYPFSNAPFSKRRFLLRAHCTNFTFLVAHMTAKDPGVM